MTAGAGRPQGADADAPSGNAAPGGSGGEDDLARRMRAAVAEIGRAGIPPRFYELARQLEAALERRRKLPEVPDTRATQPQSEG